MKQVCFILLSLLLAAPIFAKSKKWVFNITRNKNRNVVQYGIKYDSNTCKPKKRKPVYVYWRDLEEGPNVTSSIKFYEQRAYGIKKQKVLGNKVLVKLQALPQKQIEIEFSKDGDECQIISYTQINGKKQEFMRVYVFAKEGLMFPTIKYIDVYGKAGKKLIKERIKP